jgi:hypothetical protein
MNSTSHKPYPALLSDRRVRGRVPQQESHVKRPPLRQGHDPAEALYKEQARRDAEIAHKWLAAQVKK